MERNMTRIALFAALIAALGLIPSLMLASGIPITAQSLGVMLAGAVLDRVPAESSGLGAGLGRTAVQVVVPADRVGDVIAAVDQDARVTLVPSPRAVPQEGGG